MYSRFLTSYLMKWSSWTCCFCKKFTKICIHIQCSRYTSDVFRINSKANCPTSVCWSANSSLIQMSCSHSTHTVSHMIGLPNQNITVLTSHPLIHFLYQKLNITNHILHSPCSFSSCHFLQMQDQLQLLMILPSCHGSVLVGLWNMLILDTNLLRFLSSEMWWHKV